MRVSLPWLEGYWLASVIADSAVTEHTDQYLATALVTEVRKLRTSRVRGSHPDRQLAVLNALGHLAPSRHGTQLPPRMALALHRRADPISPARKWTKLLGGTRYSEQLPTTLRRLLRYYQTVNNDE